MRKGTTTACSQATGTVTATYCLVFLAPILAEQYLWEKILEGWDGGWGGSGEGENG